MFVWVISQKKCFPVVDQGRYHSLHKTFTFRSLKLDLLSSIFQGLYPTEGDCRMVRHFISCPASLEVSLSQGLYHTEQDCQFRGQYTSKDFILQNRIVSLQVSILPRIIFYKIGLPVYRLVYFQGLYSTKQDYQFHEFYLLRNIFYKIGLSVQKKVSSKDYNLQNRNASLKVSIFQGLYSTKQDCQFNVQYLSRIIFYKIGLSV